MAKERTSPPVAVSATDVPIRTRRSNYPEPFATQMEGRLKRPLGTLFGLNNFGVNHTTLVPGARSALRHAHTKSDEMVYVLSGEVALYTDAGRTVLSAGMCAGFPAGTGDAHHLVNESESDAVVLEIGDRTPGDTATYPDDDIVAQNVDGAWQFTRKDGSAY